VINHKTRSGAQLKGREPEALRKKEKPEESSEMRVKKHSGHGAPLSSKERMFPRTTAVDLE
jgi:hypothetical protein